MPAVSELRQCGSIQLGRVRSSSATARSYSTVIASSRPAALSGSTSTAAHTSASRVAPNEMMGAHAREVRRRHRRHRGA